MAVSAFISGLDRKFQEEMEAFGTRSLFVYKFDPTMSNGPRSFEERNRKPITYEDAMAIAEHCPAIEYVAPMVGPEEPRVWANGEELYLNNVSGTLPVYERIETTGISQGRYFTDAENQLRRPVAVVGAEVASTFWPNLDPLGRKFSIEGREVEVVGVLAHRDNFFMTEDDGGNVNRAVYIPYNTMKKFFPPEWPGMEEHFISLQFYQGQKDAAEDQVRQLLRRRRDVAFNAEDNFSIFSPESVTAKFHSMTAFIGIMMVVISSVGLLIGGIGVMNIMLVSVTERTKEIGIRKAIGAGKFDIVSQFLIEAATLTGTGGMFGIAVGWGVALLINMILPAHVPLWAPLFGFGVSVAIGLFCGLWPAMRAARLDPIVALRYE
jgi:ABC-type antimicrobial peptide transport system permease subunit